MGGVPSKPGDPSRPLEVIDAGYSKTGTSSMQLALEKLLDGPVMHGGTHMLYGEDKFSQRWVQAYEARARGDKEATLKLLRQVTAGFVGVTDAPNFDFVPELLEVHPDAKVVLVERDPDRWWESINVNFKFAYNRVLPVLLAPMPGLRWFPSILRCWDRAATDLMVEAYGPGTPLGPDLLTVHNNMVKRVVPPERLLVMNLKEGWAPLCAFLGKPIPDEPFPRVNESEAAEKTGKSVFLKCGLVWLGLLSGAGFGVTMTVRYLRR